MTKNLPLPFQVTPQAIATYQYSDIISGLGYITFYGAIDGTSNYFLTEQTIFSNTGISQGIGTQVEADFGTTTSQQIDVDFDTSPFNKPKYLKGSVICQIPIGAYRTNLGGQVDARVDIIHYDGTTETSLGTANGNGLPITTSADATWVDGYQTLIVAVTGKQFIIGDILRVNVQVFGNDAAGGAWSDAAIGHDPQNRDFTLPFDGTTMTGTQLRVEVPFRLDIAI